MVLPLVLVLGVAGVVAGTFIGWSRRRTIVISTMCQTTGSGAGPWPGSFYAGPMLIAAGVLGLATIATVVASANRPRVGATSPETDTLLRRASTRQILLVSASATAGSLMPVAGLMAMLLLGLSCRPWWYVPLGVFWGIVVVIASGVAAASLGTALWGPRLVDRAEEPVVVSWPDTSRPGDCLPARGSRRSGSSPPISGSRSVPSPAPIASLRTWASSRPAEHGARTSPKDTLRGHSPVTSWRQRPHSRPQLGVTG